MPLGTLSIDVEARLANLEAGFDKAARLAQQNAGRIEREFSGLKSIGFDIAASLTAAFSVAVFRQFVTATVESIDRLNDLKAATGSSIEKLSGLVDIGSRTGTSFEAISASMIKFNTILNDAKPGSVQAQVLASIGVSAAELRKQDPADALQRVAIALDKYEDSGTKARIVTELFGKSTRDVAKFLQDVASAGTLNAKVTTEQAEAAERLNNQFAEMATNSADAARRIVSDFVPALNEILKAFNEKGLIAALDKFGNLAFDWERSATRKQIGMLEQDISNLQIQLDATDLTALDKLRNGIGLLVGPGSAEEAARMTQELAAKKAQLEQLQAELLTSYSPGARGGVGAPLGPKPKAPDTSGIKADDGKRSKLQSDPKNEGLTDALRAIEQTDPRKIQALQDRLSELFNLQRETRGTPSVVEAIRATRDELDGLLRKGITGPVIADPREQIKNDFLRSEKEVYTEIKDQVSDLDQFTVQAAQNIQGALSGSIGDVLRHDFHNIGERWKDLLIQMASDAIAAKIGNYLFGDFGKTGEVSGAAGGLLKAFVGSFAVGTDNVPRTGLAMVHRGEGILTADENRKRRAAANDGLNVTFNVGSIGGDVSRAEVIAGFAEVRAQTRAELQTMLARRRAA